MSENTATDEPNEIVPLEQLTSHIHSIHGQNVMVDSDLADLYAVSTKVLNQAVKRNSTRFSNDFMFQITEMETQSLRSQFVTSNEGRSGRKYFPYVFTEQGVAMLSSVLRSERAVQVNIAIMRAFVSMRGLQSLEDTVARKILDLEQKVDQQLRSFSMRSDS